MVGNVNFDQFSHENFVDKSSQLVILYTETTKDNQETPIDMTIENIPRTVKGPGNFIFQLLGAINYKDKHYTLIVPNQINDRFTKLSDTKPKKSLFQYKKCQIVSLIYLPINNDS